MASYIIWSKAVKQELAKLAYQIRQNDLEISDIECVRQAMRSLLPREQHRDIQKMSMVPWVTKVWTDLTAGKSLEPEVTHQQPVVSVKAIPRVETLVAAPKATITYAQHKIVPIVNPQIELDSKPAPQPTIDQLSTEALAFELVKRLTSALDPSSLKDMIRREVNSVLESRLPGLLPPDDYEPQQRVRFEPEVTRAPKKMLPKVLILGLMGGQQNMLKTQYRDQLDLYFLEGNEGTNRVRNQAQSMDLTLKTHWCKGTIDLRGIPNVTNVNGMDSIRTVVKGRFNVEAVK